MKKQLIFEKYARLRFVGHLDIMRLLQRALNRAGIELVWSQGFNPHPRMSFAAPLSLGWYSTGEIMEIILAENISDEEVLSRLNAQLPDGIRILFCRTLSDKEPPIMSKVSAAQYLLELPAFLPEEEFQHQWTAFLCQETILATKIGKVKGRRQEKQVNIRPGIYDWSFCPDKAFTVRLLCACGGELNLKPDTLAWKFYDFCLPGMPQKAEELHYREKITRTAFYGQEEGTWVNYSQIPEKE